VHGGLAGRRSRLAHIDHGDGEAAGQALAQAVAGTGDLDRREPERHLGLARLAAGLSGQAERGAAGDRQGVDPRKQLAAVRQRPVVGGAHQQVRAWRPHGEGLEDVVLPVADRRQPRRRTADLGRAGRRVQPAPALLLGDRPAFSAIGLHRRSAFLPCVRLRKVACVQPQDRPARRVHRQRRVQIEPPAAPRADHGGVLDRQHVQARAALRRPRARLGHHRLRRHRRVAQQPRQADLPGPVAAQRAAPAPAARPSPPGGHAERPPFFQAAVPKPPQRHLHNRRADQYEFRLDRIEISLLGKFPS